MNVLVAKIEALLFAVAKPMSIAIIAKYLEVPVPEIEQALNELVEARNVDSSGIHVVRLDDSVQLATNPAVADFLSKVLKDDEETELTRPSLEALTIIAYRGPITKPEIEAIRGVNCTLILRNLLMRGLIEEREDVVKMQPVYTLSHDAMLSLGLHHTSELPDYAELHANARIDKLLTSLVEGATAEEPKEV